MMRAPAGWAVAVRRPDGIIEAKSGELPRLGERSAAFRFPFVRGVLVLIESLTLGFRALAWSAQKSGDEEEEITRGQAIWTMIFAAVFAIALFVLIPVLAAEGLRGFLGDSSLAFVILDGLIRLALIVGYIWLISRWDEIQRVFQYHGAEHKTIHAYENGVPLTVDRIQPYSPRHPRCGTSFLLIVGMVAFVVFLVLAPLPFAWQVIARVALIPAIAGLSYEVLKAGAATRWMAWANRPGIWLASLMAALSEEEAEAVLARGPIAPGAAGFELNVEDAD
jgi:uncharacterized protein YqhQ